MEWEFSAVFNFPPTGEKIYLCALPPESEWRFVHFRRRVWPISDGLNGFIHRFYPLKCGHNPIMELMKCGGCVKSCRIINSRWSVHSACSRVRKSSRPKMVEHDFFSFFFDKLISAKLRAEFALLWWREKEKLWRKTFCWRKLPLSSQIIAAFGCNSEQWFLCSTNDDDNSGWKKNRREMKLKNGNVQKTFFHVAQQEKIAF